MPPSALFRLAARQVRLDFASEAAFRSAAHLAYYSIYHLTAQYFGVETTDRQGSRHDQIMKRLDRVDPTGAPPYIQKVRAVYKSLWELRRSADYDLRNEFGVEQARRAVGYAGSVFDATISPV